ncbi:MAG: Fic family protein [Pseudomonadales bacterium]|nr:Fic family protein [Pseudomonadales bacterium]
MATPSDKLADSLEALHRFQEGGMIAIRSADLSRTHRERLVQNGFLQEVIKGWYIPSRPDGTQGESTAWYTSFWQFCSAYLTHLRGKNWCLSPEQSIAIHTGNWTVPKQLLVRADKARNKITVLPHGTSLLDIRASLPDEQHVVEKNGVRLFSLPAALIGSGTQIYRSNPTDMRAALSMIDDASQLLEPLLEGGHSAIAGRMAGAFRNIGRKQIADDILQTMRAAGYDVRERDPFDTESGLIFSMRESSPYVNRIRLMWQDMRHTVIQHFPEPPFRKWNVASYMENIEKIYVSDAYHSLSIEGYCVTPQLINRVRSGDWNPEKNQDDNERLNALAARGYWQAYQAVRQSIECILNGQNAGEVVDADHRIWYREMFAPGVTVGIHKPADLAGYRNGQVFIRRSMHVPPAKEAVRDAMPTFFELLRDEENAAARVVLGHFIFIYIHPYMDGNGRMGRFLMNAMLASGGYPWTIIPLSKRNEYMAALEQASTSQNIAAFAKFLGHLVQASLDGKGEPEISD